MIFRAAAAVASIFMWSVIDATAHPATGVVFDAERRVVYFSDLETVWKVDAAGRLTVFRAGDGGRHTHELAIDRDGNVYGGDISYAGGRWTSAFWRASPAGELTYLLPPTEGFAPGWGVQRDLAGNVYSVDQDNNRRRETRLLRRTTDGRVELVAGGAYGRADGRGAAARFESIWGLAVLADGTAYLTDGQDLRRVAPDGTARTLARELGGLAGLAPDGRGGAFVADNKNRRVLRVNDAGSAATVLSAEYPWSPTGVALGEDGAVYVLEASFVRAGGPNGSRVRRVAPDGTARTLAAVGAQTGESTPPQRAAARIETLVTPTRLYAALALLTLCLVPLAVRFTRRRKSREP